MKELKVTTNEFDLDQFIEEILNFTETMVWDVDPTFPIVWVEKQGSAAKFGPEEGGRDLEVELLEDRKILSFPFSSSNVGELIPCADGNEYELPDYDECGEEESEEVGEFCLGDCDCVGYLIEYTNGELVINSAIHAGGGCMSPPTVHVEADCNVFDGPMTEFIWRFVRK